MKTLLFFTLFSLNALATDYSCVSGRYKYELQPWGETFVLKISEFQGRELQYYGETSDVIQDREYSELIFEQHGREHVKLIFKTEALSSGAPVLFGLTQGFYGASAIKCYETELGI